MSEPGPSSSQCIIHASKCAGSRTEEASTSASDRREEERVKAECTWFRGTIVLQRQLIWTCLG
ncbi:hypothetical protein AN641_00435 [Candidatus Epulonipiscioides gigas]|nr:hypothetical protein AN641_00435 [Epulopiscium sp. SCG-C07WGA-EpuloA2]